MNDYDEIDENEIDDEPDTDDEPVLSETDDEVSDIDIAEAESLTVTAKQKQRDALADEVAAFLARGGKITEVPPDESARD
ncbi:hypothetical protein [Moraxella sp. ZY210820]|uniref:hypothetical protein n=1 Tax=unclassified Moraxella TaxID=2685852 RepID=UPI00272F36EB|nr:hypothetical protein [Moraxella sp. ZY210820]WLF83024.1 hypothetical protein LU301_06980 [Moraxella sp. ZY210820]